MSDSISNWVEARDTHDGHCKESTSERRFVHGGVSLGTCRMVMGSICGRMGACTKGNGRKGKRVGEGSFHGHLERPTKEISSLGKWMGLVLLLELMVILIRGLGYQIKSMGLVRSVMLMGMCIKDSGKGTCRMVKEGIRGVMGMSILVNGRVVLFLGKGAFVLANGDKYDMSWENGVPKWEREGCAGLSCVVGLLPPVSVSAKGVKREREGLCSSVR